MGFFHSSVPPSSTGCGGCPLREKSLTTHASPTLCGGAGALGPAAGLQAGGAQNQIQNRRAKFKPRLEASGSQQPTGPGVALSSPSPSPLPSASSPLPPPPLASFPLPPPSSRASQNGNCFFPGCREPVSSQGNNVSPQLCPLEFPCSGETPLWPLAQLLGDGTHLEPACAQPRGGHAQTHTHSSKQKQKRAGNRGWGWRGWGRWGWVERGTP